MKQLVVFSLLFITYLSFSQNNPSIIDEGRFLGKTIPLKDYTPMEEQVYKSTELKIISNNLRANEKLNANGLPINGIDPLVQNIMGNYDTSFNLEENFDGISVTESGGAIPPDPTGAAGPNHYMNAVNTAVKIFDKSGNLLAGPTDLGSFLGSGNNSGDPIVLYDHLADRFFISQFGPNVNSLIIGVSDSPDPLGSYDVYEFSFDSFPDYPKYTVWPDGYYLTANKGGNEVVYVLERDVILNGGTDPNIVGFNLPGISQNPNTVFSPASANLLGNTFPIDVPGYIVYLQDDGWSTTIANDHLKIWEIDVDWTLPNASTISSPIQVPVAPFDSVFAPFGFGDVNQPGTGQRIDMIGGIISYAANYRSFGAHNSWVITFNVDTDGNDTSGIRWIELRNDDVNDWSVYQEGTYAPADGNSRFMGSAAIDQQGNIGLGFNIASATLPVGIAYTGRYNNDPLGQMTVAETTIVDGIGVQTITNRFGDYSHLTMDPDGFTFWHTAEYFTSDNTWQSRVASFKLSSGFENDLGVVAINAPNNGILTTTENVEVTIRNFGTNNQFNFPVQLFVDGNLIATETFLNPLQPNQSASFTFSQTVDLSNSGQIYSLEARTSLSTDDFTQNDSFSKEVRHLLNDDVGVVSINAPESSDDLGVETVTVSVRNFGVNPQTNFPIEYTVDGGTPVTETFTQTINSEETVSFSFAQTSDFSTVGPYAITATTLLTNDELFSNNSVNKIIEKEICSPSMDCTLGDGLLLFSLADINNASGCEGYGDFLNQTANLSQNTTYPLTVTTGWGDQYLTVWIDFNDDDIFSVNEKIVTDYIIAPGQGAGNYTETLDFIVPANATVGTRRMRAKTSWNELVPDDACAETVYGETEDYTVNIQTLSLNQFAAINLDDFKIISLGDKQFDVLLETDFSGNAYISIYSILGQQLKTKKISKSTANGYQVKLDMTEAASGVYLVRILLEEPNKYLVKKIIVR